ncbi:MAG: hypothetical protein II972_01735, partial [Elusimicrobiaceae bacterium]|nr:hypothetical protein [Elusimicrobiaceae bacterium]
GKLAVDIFPDIRRHYGLVRIIHNHIPGIAPITKADFMLLPTIVRSNPFFEDDKFIVFHTPQKDGSILVSVFAKLNDEEAIIISMRKISKEEAAKDTAAKEDLNSYTAGKTEEAQNQINKSEQKQEVSKEINTQNIRETKPEIKEPKQERYISPFSAFLPASEDYLDEDLLKHDLNDFVTDADTYIRYLKTSPSLDPKTNKDKAYYNKEDFFSSKTFEVVYNIENPQDYTILVVNDDKEINKQARHALEKKGFDVLSAYDGFEVDEILEYCKRHGKQIHFVLLDSFLPYKSGYQIAKEFDNKGYSSIIISFSEGGGAEETRYKKGFDFSFNTSRNDISKVADYIAYLIQKYGFKGTPKEPKVMDNKQTYYLEQNYNQNLANPIQLSQLSKQTSLTTEIKEEQNPLLFLSDSPAIQPNTSSASVMLLLSIILFSKIGFPNSKKSKEKHKKENANVYYTKDIKSQEETPLNIKVKVDPNLRAFRKYDRIVFDKDGIAYYRGDKGTKVISNFYITIPGKKTDLKLLMRAVRAKKLAVPFEIKFTFSQYDKAEFQRVLLYDAHFRVLNINVLLPQGVLKDNENIMFSNGAFYTFNKQTLKRKIKLDNFSLRVPKKQIPNLTEVFSDSKVTATFNIVPNEDKAKVVYRESMLTNVSLGKTFAPVAKKELTLTDTQASALMLGIQYFVPLLSLVIKPLIRKLGEKGTLLTALLLSSAAGVMASLAGFNGFTHQNIRATWQQGIFITAFIFMSLSTLLRQLVSTILIRDNTGVVKETETAPEDKDNSSELEKDEGFVEKKEKKTFKDLFTEKNKIKNVYSIPVELIFSKAFVSKSIGTLLFLTFPFLMNKAIYLASAKTITTNFDYGLSFPLLAILSAFAAFKTYKTNLRDRSSEEKNKVKKEDTPRESLIKKIK